MATTVDCQGSIRLRITMGSVACTIKNLGRGTKRVDYLCLPVAMVPPVLQYMHITYMSLHTYVMYTCVLGHVQQYM